jgi:hypothetical protein
MAMAGPALQTCFAAIGITLFGLGSIETPEGTIDKLCENRGMAVLRRLVCERVVAFAHRLVTAW